MRAKKTHIERENELDFARMSGDVIEPLLKLSLR